MKRKRVNDNNINISDSDNISRKKGTKKKKTVNHNILKANALFINYSDMYWTMLLKDVSWFQDEKKEKDDDNDYDPFYLANEEKAETVVIDNQHLLDMAIPPKNQRLLKLLVFHKDFMNGFRSVYDIYEYYKSRFSYNAFEGYPSLTCTPFILKDERYEEEVEEENTNHIVVGIGYYNQSKVKKTRYSIELKSLIIQDDDSPKEYCNIKLDVEYKIT